VSSVYDSVSWDDALTDEDRLLLCDAQTSGGLLMSVASERAAQLIAALEARNAPCASVVGRIIKGPAGTIRASR
jgi:selenide,water dikinase